MFNTGEWLKTLVHSRMMNILGPLQIMFHEV